MIRESKLKSEGSEKDGIRLRGKDVSRIEAFSDAVFGFALTLLVVTLSAPQSPKDLIGLLRGLPVFAVCFTMLYALWNAHYTFCRRYGMEDGAVRVLTGVLLFTVLFFVYPLKYIFMLFIDGFLGWDPTINAGLKTADDLAMVFIVYGCGWVATMTVFALLYRHAYRRRDALQLSPREAFRTKSAAIGFVLNALVGVFSILLALALPPKLLALSGFSYFTVGIAAGLHGGWESRRAQAFEGHGPAIE